LKFSLVPTWYPLLLIHNWSLTSSRDNFNRRQWGHVMLQKKVCATLIDGHTLVEVWYGYCISQRSIISLVSEHKGSTMLTPQLTTEHVPEPVKTLLYRHYLLFPYDTSSHLFLRFPWDFFPRHIQTIILYEYFISIIWATCSVIMTSFI